MNNPTSFPRHGQPNSPTPATVTPVEAVRAPEPALYPDEVTALALSPAQLTAIQSMLSGHSLGASADAAGITRMTLYRWLHKDPKFRAAYNAWQSDAIMSVRTKLLSMSDAAVTTIGRAVKSDPKIALGVLKALGTLTPPEAGSTDPEEVETQMDIDQQKKESELSEARLFAGLGSPARFGLGGGATEALRELKKMREQEEARKKRKEAEQGNASGMG
jgi:hypothetical protein